MAVNANRFSPTETPRVQGPLPGAIGQDFVDRLASFECPALTTRRARRAEQSGAPHDPIVWTRALGANVFDTDGNRYVDLTAGFGVAAVGHQHPDVVAAIQAQAGRLAHALGDLYPSDLKIALVERLSSFAPFDNAKVILGLGGADAVTAALKTAALHTGRPGVVAFEGAYHGLSYGPLATCGYSEAFRAPFQAQLNPHVRFAPFPSHETDIKVAIDAVARTLTTDTGAIIVEPIQGRGGVRIPPPGFLAALADLAHQHGLLLIVDEIQTGLGRTGARLRIDDDPTDADLVCIGKALGGGMPISACLGSPSIMEAWGNPDGAAIHTGTFYGNPLACAASMAALDVIEREDLQGRANNVGEAFREVLRGLPLPSVVDVRGAGLLTGVELPSANFTLALVRRLLERGYIALPAGQRAEVLQIIPPLHIELDALEAFAVCLQDEVKRLEGSGQ